MLKSPTSAKKALSNVHEELEQLVHECIDLKFEPQGGLDVVQRLSTILENLDAAISSVPTSQVSQRGANILQSTLEATDVNRIALAEEGGTETPQAALSPGGTDLSVRAAARKRQSVSFLPESPALSPKAFSPDSTIGGTSPTSGEGEAVSGYLQRHYSGFGSFRRQSKVQADAGLMGVVDSSLAFAGEGMPNLDLSAADVKSNFSRPTNRHTAVFAEQSYLFDELIEHFPFDIIQLHNIDEPAFDVFSVKDDPTFTDLGEKETNSRVFIIVAFNVLLKYSLVTSFQFKIDRLSRFLTELANTFSVTPFHNALHAADQLQACHAYFCQTNVKENFTDLELFSTLFAAMVCHMGHQGVTNDFLARVDHPLVHLFTDTCPNESFSAALGFKLLANQDCNFLETPLWLDDPLNHLTFREMATEAVIGSASRYHLTHMVTLETIIENGVVKNEDVPQLLSAVVHAADFRYTTLPEATYLQWVGRFVEEHYRQGDEEDAQGFDISELCDRNQASMKVLAQIGFLRHVVQPLLQEMAPVLPKEWLPGLQENLDKHGGAPTSPGAEGGPQRDSFALEGSGGADAAPLSPLRSEADVTTFDRGVFVDNSGDLLQGLLSAFRSTSDEGHGYALLRLLFSHLNDEKQMRVSDFEGHSVSLAAKLDENYIGKEALAILRANYNGELPANVREFPFPAFQMLGAIITDKEGVVGPLQALTENSSAKGKSWPSLVVALQTYRLARSRHHNSSNGSSRPNSSAEGNISNNASSNSLAVGRAHASPGRWVAPAGNSVYGAQ